MDIIGKTNKVLFYISLFLACIMFSILKNDADLDLWHRMAVGKIFSQLGNVCYHDIFAYVPTKPFWIDIEWLSGVIFYNISHYFGDFGIISLKVIILFSIIILIYKTTQLIHPEIGKQRIIWFLVVIVAVLPGIASTLRCQAFTYLFFTLWLYLLERIRRGENRFIWVFPAIMLLWTNMHGGFVSGLGLIVFYIVGEFLNKKNPLKYIGILLLSLCGTLITPYGSKYWSEVIQTIIMPRPYITEWKSLHPFQSFYKVIGTKMEFMLLIPALIYGIFSKKFNLKENKIDWVEIVSFLGTLFISIKILKLIPFLSIIIGVFGYKYFAVFMDTIDGKIKEKIYKFISEEKHFYANLLKFAIVYSFIINAFLLIIFNTPYEISLCPYPTKAVEFIKKNELKGNLLIPFNWGGYALWKLYPQNLVSLDGRYNEPYTNESYMNISNIFISKKNTDFKQWKKTFNTYHHDVLLVNKNYYAEKNILKLKEWKSVYEDKQSVVFVPSSTPDRKWIQPNKDENYYIKTKYENNINF